MSIFSINSASFETLVVTGSFIVSGSFSINDNPIADIVGEYVKKEIVILSGSVGTYVIPKWAKTVEVICVGGGGAGGGGVSVTGSNLAIGASGGSGGNVSYGILYEPELHPNKTWAISYFNGKKAEGGQPYYGSGSRETSNFGKPVISNLSESISKWNEYENKVSTGFVANDTFYGLNSWYALYAYQNISFLHTGSVGENGGNSFVFLFESSSNGWVKHDDKTIVANGGQGGFGGIAIKFDKQYSENQNGWPQSNTIKNNFKLWPFVESVSSKIETNFGITNTSQESFVGGPSGYGVSQPISTITESRGYYLDEYLQSSINMPQVHLTDTSPSLEILQNTIMSRFNKKHLVSRMYNSSLPVGPTGGAGGNGWGTSVFEYPMDVFDRTDTAHIGVAGKHYHSYKNGQINFYEFSNGGNGGNSKTIGGSLTPTLPTSGSGYGAGGGGGASDAPGGNPQAGASGSMGVVMLVITGHEKSTAVQSDGLNNQQ